MITDLEQSTEFIIPKEYNEIAEAIRNVYGYCRYEPTNPYVFHKTVPAARNIHVNEAYLILNGNVVRFNPRRNYFECVTYLPEKTGKVQLISVAEMWRVMKYYGEFGMILPLLDGGHLLAQLKLELEKRAVFSGTVLMGAQSEEEYEQMGLSNQSNLITFEIDFEVSDQYTLGQMIFETAHREMNYDNEVMAYEISEDYLRYEKMNTANRLFADIQIPAWKPDVKKREAAHNFIGITSMKQTVTEEVVDVFTDLYMQYVRHYLPTDYRFTTRIFYTLPEGDSLRVISGETVKDLRGITLDKKCLLHDTERMIDMESIPISVYFSYRYDEQMSEKENIYTAHLYSAELCHFFSVLGPLYGFFSRPMRNLEDAYLDEHFGENGETFMYSLIMGKANRRNTVIYL